MAAVSLDALAARGAAIVLLADPSGGPVIVEAGEGTAGLLAHEFELGDGPMSEAHRDGDVVTCADLGDREQGRWPSLAPLADGNRAVLAAPVRVGAEALGVLLVCRGTVGAWTDDDQLDAALLAELAATGVLDRLVGRGTTDLDLVPQQAVVHQATGMLAERLGIGLAEALARLRARAYADGRSLYDVCVDVVTRVMDVEL